MIRFFVSPKDISGGIIKLNEEDAAHIKALRLRPGEPFAVCDGEGTDYVCRLCGRSATVGGDTPAERSKTSTDGGKKHASGQASVGKSQTSEAEILETYPSRAEPSISCSVYIAYSQGDRLDYSVQKSVELGTREIILFPAKRCEHIPGDILKKTARLQKIALEAAKQSGRGIVPSVTPVESYEEAIGRAAHAELPLFLYECEEKLHLKQALTQYEGFSSGGERGDTANQQRNRAVERNVFGDSISVVSIVIGPEGGFEPSEAETAKTAGMTTVTLGPRILRCETAPAAALAAIMYHTDNL